MRVVLYNYKDGLVVRVVCCEGGHHHERERERERESAENIYQ